jgi:hypothetical protein
MRINILNKVGMLSDADRKMPFEHTCEHFTFKTNLDLTEVIKVIPIGHDRYKVYNIVDYSNDLATFITFWTQNVLPDLNGFSGFHNVKYDLDDFSII